MTETANLEAFRFTADWFGGNIPVWQSHLGAFVDRPNVTFLEIGVYEGRATVWLLGNVLTHETATIDCIDLFLVPGSEEHFDHNIRTTQATAKVRKMKGLSQEIIRGLTLNHYDVIYVDGSHDAPDVLADAVLAFATLSPGGIMIFDDYEWGFHHDPLLEPKLAIDAFLNIYQRKLQLLHKDYQVLIKKL
jgi:predicted O-methyltransferase YrrM